MIYRLQIEIKVELPSDLTSWVDRSSFPIRMALKSSSRADIIIRCGASCRSEAWPDHDYENSQVGTPRERSRKQRNVC